MCIKKLQSSQNNPEKSYTEKKAKHEPSGWAMFIRCSFDKKENKLNYYKGKDCIEELCKKLKESVMETIKHEKKMTPSTHKENNFYNQQEICYICKQKFCVNKMIKIILIEKSLKIIVIIQEKLEELPIVNAI